MLVLPVARLFQVFFKTVSCGTTTTIGNSNSHNKQHFATTGETRTALTRTKNHRRHNGPLHHHRPQHHDHHQHHEHHQYHRIPPPPAPPPAPYYPPSHNNCQRHHRHRQHSHHDRSSATTCATNSTHELQQIGSITQTAIETKRNRHNIFRKTTDNLPLTTYNIQHTTCNFKHTNYNLQHATYNIQHTSSNIQHATCNIQQTKITKKNNIHFTWWRTYDSLASSGQTREMQHNRTTYNIFFQRSCFKTINFDGWALSDFLSTKKQFQSTQSRLNPCWPCQTVLPTA